MTGKRNSSLKIYICHLYNVSLASSRVEQRSAKQMPLRLQIIIIAIKTNLDISLRSLF